MDLSGLPIQDLIQNIVLLVLAIFTRKNSKKV
jgi:hypothetical protein